MTPAPVFMMPVVTASRVVARRRRRERARERAIDCGLEPERPRPGAVGRRGLALSVARCQEQRGDDEPPFHWDSLLCDGPPVEELRSGRNQGYDGRRGGQQEGCRTLRRLGDT